MKIILETLWMIFVVRPRMFHRNIFDYVSRFHETCSKVSRIMICSRYVHIGLSTVWQAWPDANWISHVAGRHQRNFITIHRTYHGVIDTKYTPLLFARKNRPNDGYNEHYIVYCIDFNRFNEFRYRHSCFSSL